MNITGEKLCDHMAIAVSGLDLNRLPDDARQGALRDALTGNLVLCIRGQKLAPLAFRDAMARAGTPMQRDIGEGLEIRITGGLMLAETERDIEVFKGKIALEKSRGIEAELIGANELRRLEPAIGDVAVAADHLLDNPAVGAHCAELMQRFEVGHDGR